MRANQHQPIEKADLLDKLNTYVPNYQKNTSITSLILPHLHTAMINAERLEQDHIRKKVDLYSRESNPFTNVFKLVDIIVNN